jgi:L,D-transpeptidase YcbB
MQIRAIQFVLICMVFAACSANTPSSNRSSTELPGAHAQNSLENLDAAGTAELRALVVSARLADLQWANFSDHSASVKDFYDDTGYKLGWVSGGKATQQARAVIEILEQAERKGLNSVDYDGSRWPERLKVLQAAASQSTLIKFDVALTVSAIRYLSDLHLGKVDPKILHKDFDPERPEHDPGAFLAKEVINAPNVSEVLAQVEPPFVGYQRAVAALEKDIQLAQQEVPDPLPQPVKPVSPGQNYEQLEKLARRLQFLGDLPGSFVLPQGSTVYSDEIVQAVKAFQLRHGLEAEGKLGPQTIDALNRPVSDRVEQLRLALERWRWAPHVFSQPPVIVNIPEFVLRAYDGPGKIGLTMQVVVGRAMRTQTPVMEEDMKYVVFWPYWNVPPSILRGEIIPKIVKDPAYLQKNGYEVATYQGKVVTDGVVSDDVLAQLRAGKLMVRQKPGPKNALGLIKFIFPNDNNVYLHSTPAQSLFSRSRRDFSHGCIRVEDPKALAVWVLRNNPGWTRERVDAAFAAEKEQQVNLAKTIPVLIVYATAIAKENGQVFFFDDIYGYDKAMQKLFDQAYNSQK